MTDSLGAIPDRSWTVLRWMLVTACAWYLLRELAPLLRPLLLAVFLAYVVLPVGVYVKGQVRGGVAHLIPLFGLGALLAVFGVLSYGDLVELSRDFPRLQERTQDIFAQATAYARAHIPQLADLLEGTARAEEQGTSRIQEALSSLGTLTLGVLVEAVQVVFFLILILVEAGRLPERLRHAFADEQAQQVFAMVSSINAAMASYLKAKVKVNALLALPVMIVLWICGIKFVILWGALTFLANFVPYLGSIVACALPIFFGFLDLDFGWQPVAAAILLPVVHVTMAYLVEPALTGKAVDLNPLVVLIALSFWGLCWGVTGMVLAVPLTAMFKIILQSAPSSRPVAWLMGEEGAGSQK
jgi:AI-2 transport protein TqsA